MTEKEIKIEAKKILDERGCTYWFPQKVQFQQYDIFGVFDFIAVEPAHYPFYVQLTTTPHRAARRKKVLEFLAQKDFKINAWLWIYDVKKSCFIFELLSSE